MDIAPRKVLINDSVVSAGIGDEAVLLDVQTGVYYGLDAVGTQIWDLLAKGATEEDIFNHLVDEYEVEANRLRRDISQFVDELTGKGLTRMVNG